MPENDNTGTLRVVANRGGTVSEISQFLIDLERAYVALYRLDNRLSRSWPQFPRRMRYEFFELGYPLLALEDPVRHPESLLPEHRLVIQRVRIESPGFWEVLASFNPLQQIREYLNDVTSAGRTKNSARLRSVTSSLWKMN